MIKRILVPLDHSKYSESAVELACFIAKYHESEITGMVVLDLPGIEHSLGSTPIGGMYYAEKLEEKKRKEAEEHIRKILEKFEEQITAQGIKFRAASLQGSPLQQIIDHSIYYDLVVSGSRLYCNFDAPRDGMPLTDLLDQTITPIYAVPEEINPPDISVEKVRTLIAFDGSMASARALQEYAHLVRPDAVDVTLLTAKQEKEEAENLLDEAEHYLRAHGIETITRVRSEKDIIAEIEDRIEDMHAVVVGVNAKKRFMKYFVGSTTKRVLDMNKRPVLLGH